MRLIKSACLVGIVSTVSATAFASDHADSPNGSTDPTADVTDIFAFASPEKPGNLVVVMNTTVAAFANTRFSDAVTYSIRLRPEPVSGSAPVHEVRIDCTFDLVPNRPDQLATCTAYDFDPATGRLNGRTGGKPTPVNESTSGSDGLRIFTGLRADPWHIDAQGSVSALRGEGWNYTTAKNTIAGLDCLSIVAEIDSAKFFGKSTQIKIAGETTMRVRP